MAFSTTTTKLDFVTLDVFTPTRFLGNPLAVVFIPAAQRSLISQETKQRIAREFNLSETVFLHTLDDEPDTGAATREIDIFTPRRELPFAGHPTIGSAYWVLHSLGWTHVDTLLTKAGPIRIQPQAAPGSVKATIPHAVHIHQQTLGGVLAAEPAAATESLITTGLSDDEEVRAAELAAPLVSIVRGMTFLLVKLPSLEHLARVTTSKPLDFGQINGFLDAGEWNVGYVGRYYYVPTGAAAPEPVIGDEGSQNWAIRTRMVGQSYEDPATGSAASTLASYLTITGRAVQGARFAITQGMEMGRQSEIEVEVSAAVEGTEVKVQELFLGGTAVETAPLQLATPHLSTALQQIFIMLCALSGEVPEEPVVSTKTGTIYEKRLILKYIEENGKEPGTDAELDPEDLLPIKTGRTVRPRPPNFTSLPSLLKAFQDEWDALVLESYNTKEQLARTREELATALYQHDAAVRVIARLTRERDEARDALSKVTVTATAGNAAGGDAMQVDNDSLPAELAEHVDELHQRLTKGRKKRPVPAEWATPDDVASLQQIAQKDLSVTQASTLALHSDFAAIGGLDGILDIYSLSNNEVERSLEIGEPVTGTVWVENKIILATAKGAVESYFNGQLTNAFREHSGPITGLSVHPGGRIVASVGTDKSFAFYDSDAGARVSRVYTDTALTACAFHPDGHLFAAGTQSGEIRVYETKTGQLAATFVLGPPVNLIVFSENGFWFAATGKGQSTVTIFDLRKDGPAAQVKELQTGDVQSLAWDYTGQFLATAGASGVTVQQYLKSSKQWSEPLRNAAPAVAIQWGADAKSLVAVSKEGTVSVLGLAAAE
ncbi:hypothetical protein B0T22DRAFT_502547 [Podospora appendiculata]|uniref:Pre-mRNA-processing factor 19 n=1 Tax=Podospora appendiculata TaxID=314037 RepID=A0AAE0WZ58_9PEZI|nr:hypothetical protein B0T22DRAFT_502547 [Podospora appendiculata]